MEKKIRFMTFNIQHGFDHLRKDGIRLGAMAEKIALFSPDIISLNEVRNGDTVKGGKDDLFDNSLYFDETKYLAELLGYEYFFFGKSIDISGGEYGNAVISRFPMENAEVFKIPDTFYAPEKHYESRTILRASFTYPLSFDVYISHFGVRTTEEREKAVELILSLTENSKVPFAFMGDLNDTPDADCLKPLYEKYTDALEAMGRKFDPTFISDAPTKRIDHIFVSRNVSVSDAFAPADAVASDHLPVVADAVFTAE